jgi:hypothetical protein
MSHLASILTNGTFEKYPELRIIVKGAGFGWIPALMWRLDVDYFGCRSEVPWLKHSPSEYFYQHVAVCTQPLDSAPSTGAMRELLDCIEDHKVLVYGSCYPNVEMDAVDDVARRMPTLSHRELLFENALRFYGWADLGATLRAQSPSR